MEIIKFIKATIDYFKYYSENPSNYTKQAEFIKLVQNNNSVLENLMQELWQPNKNVVVGQVIWSPNMPSNTMAIVDVAGVTDEIEPTWETEVTKENIVHYKMENKVKLSKVNLSVFYPVGSIYQSTKNTSPTELFGGTWKSLNEGRTLRGVTKNYLVNSIGGESEHVLTTAEMACHTHDGSISTGGSHNHSVSSNDTGSHTHEIPLKSGSGSGIYHLSAKTKNYTITTSSTGAHSHTITVNTSGHSHTFIDSVIGGGQAHNNMQPWRAVYMWERIA